MFRLRPLNWMLFCVLFFSALVPTLPSQAAPLNQEDITEYIAEIRSGSPAVEENFAGTNSLFSVGFDGTTSSYIRFGELRIAVDEENVLSWSALDRRVGDFYLEVDTIHREGSLDNQFGILARMDEDTNYYLFAASSDGYYTIQINIDDEWETLVEWTETDLVNIGEGETNTLGLLAEGDSYTFLINDAIVDEVTDDTLSGNIVALNAAAFNEPPIDIAFDNFRLWYVGEQIAPAPRTAPVDSRRNITPTPTPTASATEEATEEATTEPTEEVTEEATEEATAESTAEITATVTPKATSEATPEPTGEATEETTTETTVAVGTSSDPTIAVIQGQEPTFSDDFEDGETSDWINFPNDAVGYEVVEGEFVLSFDAPNVLSWSELPVRPSNYYLEADATIISDLEAAEYGIIFNYVDPQNFYLFAINNDSRYSVWQLINNSWEVVYQWHDSAALVAGEGNTNRLGLLVQETTVTLTANDEVLTAIEIEQPASGSIALAAGTFEEPNLAITFDNVLLWDLDTLGPLPTAEPTSEATEEANTEESNEEVNNEEAIAEVEARIAEIVETDPALTDDFRRYNGTWDTQSHDFGDYFYESRAFHIEATAIERIVWSAYYENETVTEPVQFSDFYVEFDTTFVIHTGENGAGLVFRLADTDNFYKFIVDEVGYIQLQKRVDGEYSDVIEWTLTTDVVDDSDEAVNRIGIYAEGSTLALSINGTVVAVTEDTDLTSGAIALAIQTYSSDEGESIFDNLTLWDLSE